jgi:hypothetical protein
MNKEIVLEKLERLIDDGEVDLEEVDRVIESVRGSFHIWKEGDGVYTAQTTGRVTTLFGDHFFPKDERYGKGAGSQGLRRKMEESSFILI